MTFSDHMCVLFLSEHVFRAGKNAYNGHQMADYYSVSATPISPGCCGRQARVSSATPRTARHARGVLVLFLVLAAARSS